MVNQERRKLIGQIQDLQRKHFGKSAPPSLLNDLTDDTLKMIFKVVQLEIGIDSTRGYRNRRKQQTPKNVGAPQVEA